MIIGIVGLLLEPQFSSIISETKLNEATGELLLALEYARNLAARYQRVFSVRVKESDNSFQVIDYRYKDDPNPHLDADPPVRKQGILYHPVDKDKYERDFDNMEEYQGVDITSLPSDYYICFCPDGHSLDTDITFLLCLGDHQRAITIDGLTGRITVQ
jgi:Tfp pilus assembly protein FimT